MAIISYPTAFLCFIFIIRDPRHVNAIPDKAFEAAVVFTIMMLFLQKCRGKALEGQLNYTFLPFAVASRFLFYFAASALLYQKAVHDPIELIGIINIFSICVFITMIIPKAFFLKIYRHEAVRTIVNILTSICTARFILDIFKLCHEDRAQARGLLPGQEFSVNA